MSVLKRVNDSTIKTFEIETVDKRIKKKHRIVCLRGDELYISPEIAGMSEKIAFLCNSADGSPVVVSGKNIYVSINWLKGERPHLIKDLEKVERIIRDAVEPHRG